MTASPDPSAQPRAGAIWRLHHRVLTAALVGTTVEFYDFYVFATATALVFGPLFFPQSSPTAQAIAAFMVFGIAFVARPLGAIAFGHFGDRVGRKSTLVGSLLLMGGSTLAVAFLPSYAALEHFHIGWLAPVLLCVLRFGQGFGLGGEWGGAALLAVEYAPRGWESRFGAAPQLGAPLGFLASNGIFLALGLWLSPHDFLTWGWRIPFLASALLVGVGLWVRLRIAETPAFRAALEREPPVVVPLARVVVQEGRALLTGSLGAIACFAVFYLSTAFALAHGTGQLGYPRVAFLGVQLAANLFLAAGIVVAAIWADRVGPARVLAAGAGLSALVGLGFGAGLASGSLLGVFVTLSAALFAMGLAYGPLGSWLPGLFPVNLRYSGISLAFSGAGVIGGALTPIAARVLADRGYETGIGLLMSAAGLLSLVGILWARPARG